MRAPVDVRGGHGGARRLGRDGPDERQRADATIGAGVGLWWDCSMLLTAPGGSWKGVTGYGSEYVKSSQLRTNGTNIYEGQGAFAGLRYVTLFTGSPETRPLYGEAYVVAGWIEPVE